MKTEEQMVITSFGVQEVVFGALGTQDRKNYERTLEFLKAFSIIGYGAESAIKAAEIQRYMGKKGAPIGVMDMMIAAVCLTHNAAIITRNTRHFSSVPGLLVEKW